MSGDVTPHNANPHEAPQSLATGPVSGEGTREREFGGPRWVRSLQSIGWAIVGLISGACVGNYIAVKTVGSDPCRARGAFPEALVTDCFVGAMIGVVIGWLIGVCTERFWYGNARFLWIAWSVVLFGAILLEGCAPGICARE